MGSTRNEKGTGRMDVHTPELYMLTDGSHVISSQHGQLGGQLEKKRQEELWTTSLSLPNGNLEGLPNGNY